jgi:hypothetical protein
MDGAAQKQETRLGNMWQKENKGSKQRRSDQGWDGWYMQQAI